MPSSLLKPCSNDLVPSYTGKRPPVMQARWLRKQMLKQTVVPAFVWWGDPAPKHLGQSPHKQKRRRTTVKFTDDPPSCITMSAAPSLERICKPSPDMILSGSEADPTVLEKTISAPPVPDVTISPPVDDTAHVDVSSRA